MALILLFSWAKLRLTLWPHGLQHARLPCTSLSPGVCSNSCSLSWWCHSNVSSSVSPFSFSPQSFPTSGSFPELAVCIRCPNYWIFSFSISPSSEYSGLISFRIDWLDLLAVQGTLKTLLQHHNLKTLSITPGKFGLEWRIEDGIGTTEIKLWFSGEGRHSSIFATWWEWSSREGQRLAYSIKGVTREVEYFGRLDESAEWNPKPKRRG